MARMLKWTVEFHVDESWVADGFDLTPECAKLMIEEVLPNAYGHETEARVIEAPDRAEIERVQNGEDSEDED